MSDGEIPVYVHDAKGELVLWRDTPEGAAFYGDPPPAKPNGGHSDPPPWEPPGEPAPAPRILRRFSEITAPLDPYYLVKGILPRRGLTVIWGPPKCGKSFWILDLALHVALGRTYRGHKTKAGPVVYIACEGGHQFGARIAAFRNVYLPENFDDDVPFFLITGTLDLIREHKRLAIEIAAVCPNPALTIIDTVNRSLDGSEVDDMPVYIKATDFLGTHLATSTTVVHHCGVAGERPRGHSSLTGNADAQIAVKKSDSGLVTATVEFMKDGQDGEVLTSRIRKVELGTDTDGDPRDSCVIDPAEDPVPAASRNRVGGNQATALALIADSMPAGLTVEELNARLRDAGIGKSRTATLVEIRLALKAKKLVHEYADRWYLTPY